MTEGRGDPPVASLAAVTTRLRGAVGRAVAPVRERLAGPDTDRTATELLAECLSGVPGPRVAVLVNGSAGDAVQSVRRAVPDAVVTKVGVGVGASVLHARLAAAGPFDAILDRTRRPAVRGRVFQNAFFHLRPGGGYVVARHVSQESTLGAGQKGQALSTHLARMESGRPAERLDGDHLVLVNQVRALAKLNEREANKVLELRGGPDRVLHTVAGTAFPSRCTFTSSNGQRRQNMPDLYDVPAASLREYHQATCLPGQVVTKDNLLLPDTYRHNQARRLANRYTVEVARRFATLPEGVDDAPLLEGTYFYLDNEIRGHFGHAMTEQLSRLWALPKVRELAPDVKAVLAVNTRKELQPFELELYGAAGFAPDELVLLHEPTRVERLLAATPMFSMPHYVHPAIEDTWQRVGDALASRATLQPHADRIFISRRIRKRACLNTDAVEDLFTSHGFEVVYPEDYSMADQVVMFRRAEVIAGFAGSGLFNICFAPGTKTVIMLAHAAYSATNEYQMASVRGHDLISIVSDIDRTEDQDARKVPLFQSSFSVDFEREGKYLAGVLQDL